MSFGQSGVTCKRRRQIFSPCLEKVTGLQKRDQCGASGSSQRIPLDPDQRLPFLWSPVLSDTHGVNMYTRISTQISRLHSCISFEKISVEKGQTGVSKAVGSCKGFQVPHSQCPLSDVSTSSVTLWLAVVWSPPHQTSSLGWRDLNK